ncbi:MAG TPA: hypothetical protein DDZ84_02870, partial [Firmicutes bacterium]|nr:hypothetical protein [Bacillota bacterium]
AEIVYPLVLLRPKPEIRTAWIIPLVLMQNRAFPMIRKQRFGCIRISPSIVFMMKGISHLQIIAALLLKAACL